MEVTKIKGKAYKASWEQEGKQGEWYAMDDTLSETLEKTRPSAKAWQCQIKNRPDEPNNTEPARRYYDLKNMTQCRQHLVHQNEWKTVSRIVKIRRIYREITVITNADKWQVANDKANQSASDKKKGQQAGTKVNQSASGKKVNQSTSRKKTGKQAGTKVNKSASGKKKRA